MVQIARMKGLEGICVTDHDSKEQQIFKKIQFPIFVGTFTPCKGDIVASMIIESPAQDFIDLVNAQEEGILSAKQPGKKNLAEYYDAKQKHFCGGMPEGGKTGPFIGLQRLPCAGEGGCMCKT